MRTEEPSVSSSQKSLPLPKFAQQQKSNEARPGKIQKKRQILTDPRLQKEDPLIRRRTQPQKYDPKPRQEELLITPIAVKPTDLAAPPEKENRPSTSTSSSSSSSSSEAGDLLERILTESNILCPLENKKH